MKVLIEGPDGSGKSTLARALSRRLKVPLIHSGGPAKSRMEIAGRMGHLLRRDDPIIYDRIPLISDCVYGPILRGGSSFLDNYLWHASLLLREATILPIIFCRPPTQIIIDNLDRDQSEKATKSAEHINRVKIAIHQILNAYDRIIADFPHFTIDYTLTTSSLTIDQIVNFIYEKEAR